jgi:D-apiose dehydrogenase
MNALSFAIFGTGFWSRYQLAAWREIPGARCVALYNRTRSKAEQLAAEFAVPAVYDDPEELLQREKPDFIDIITDISTHRAFVELAAFHRTPVICQKPLAPSWADAEAMVSACRAASVPLFVHENWRWQSPLRKLKELLDAQPIGRIFRARVTYSNSFPVFDNQPFLKTIDQFILMDVGTHILDAVRMLFGEADTLVCRTARVHPDIRGEDVATLLLGMRSGATVTCELSYASRLEHERFPETYILIEGDRGSIELGPDFWLRVTTELGTHSQRHPPPFHSWADPRYALAQVSGIACNANLLAALRGEQPAETTGSDNLETLRLVFGAYESAATQQPVQLRH